MDDETGLKWWSLGNLTSAIVRSQLESWSSCKILELGCGVFPVLEPMIRLGKADLTVSDCNLQVLDQVQEAFADCGNLKLKVLDWSKWEPGVFEEHSFDIVVANEVLYYNVNVDEMLQTVAKLLHKERGFFLLVSHQRELYLRQLKSAADTAGLRFRLYDIFQVNSKLKDPAQVEGWCILASFAHRSSDDSLLHQVTVLTESEKSVDDEITSEEMENEDTFAFPDM